MREPSEKNGTDPEEVITHLDTIRDDPDAAVKR